MNKSMLPSEPRETLSAKVRESVKVWIDDRVAASEAGPAASRSSIIGDILEACLAAHDRGLDPVEVLNFADPDHDAEVLSAKEEWRQARRAIADSLRRVEALVGPLLQLVTAAQGDIDAVGDQTPDPDAPPQPRWSPEKLMAHAARIDRLTQVLERALDVADRARKITT